LKNATDLESLRQAVGLKAIHSGLSNRLARSITN